MVPSNDGNRFFAFGRIFSGTVRPKTDIIVMNSDHIVGTTVAKKSKISRVVLMMGKTIENVESVPCGNSVGIAGLEAVLVKSGTIATLPETYPITPMKFSVSPVVRRALTLENVTNLGTFVKALEKLVHSDPCLEVIREASGECIIAGAGELHIDVCLTDLQEFLGDTIKFKVSPPVVKFTGTHCHICSSSYLRLLLPLFCVFPCPFCLRLLHGPALVLPVGVKFVFSVPKQRLLVFFALPLF